MPQNQNFDFGELENKYREVLTYLPAMAGVRARHTFSVGVDTNR
jgi:hypothetical protein